MFTTSVGTPLDASHVRRDFRALCKKAGIEGVWSPRELRHTFVSVMSESGVAVEEIARLAGHASSRTTETIYRHELRPVITTGADVMDQLFAAAQRDGSLGPRHHAASASHDVMIGLSSHPSLN